MRLLWVALLVGLILPMGLAATNNCQIVTGNSCPAPMESIAGIAQNAQGHLTIAAASTSPQQLCCDPDVNDAATYQLFSVTDAGDSQGHVCAPSLSCGDSVMGTLQSCRVTSTLSAGEICVLRMSDSQQGHVADCADPAFSNMVACSNTARDCSTEPEGTACSLDGTWNVSGVAYCSEGLYPAHVNPPRCCAEGFYWDPVLSDTLGCIVQDDCYDILDPFGNANLCNYEVDDSPDFYDTDRSDCVDIPDRRACCSIGDVDADGVINYERNLDDTSLYSFAGGSGPSSFDYVQFCQNAPNPGPSFDLYCDDGTDNICPEDFTDSDGDGIPNLFCDNPDPDCTSTIFFCDATPQSITAGDDVKYDIEFRPTPVGLEMCEFDTGVSIITDTCASFDTRTEMVTYPTHLGSPYTGILTRLSDGTKVSCPQITVAEGSEAGQCTDEVDNDGDGLTDYCDPDCDCPIGEQQFSCTACGSCTVSPSSISTGDKATTTLSLTGTPNSSNTCTFLPGDGNTIGSQSCFDGATFEHIYTTQGVRTPRLIHQASTDSITCSNSVTVGDSCVTIDSVSYPANIFAGDPFDFVVDFTDDEVGTSWSMDFDHGAPASGATTNTGGTPITISKTYPAAGDYTYNFQMNDFALCNPLDSATITVQGAPSVDVSCSANNVEMNTPTTLTYTITDTGYSGPVNVEVLWNASTPPEVFASTSPTGPAPTRQHIYTLNDAHTATVNVYDTSMNILGSATCPVLVNGPPQITWTALPTPSSAIVPVDVTGYLSVRDEKPLSTYNMTPGDIVTGPRAGPSGLLYFEDLVVTASPFTLPQIISTAANVSDTDGNFVTASQSVVATCVGAGGSATGVDQCCANHCFNPSNSTCVTDASCNQAGGTNLVCHGPTKTLVDPDDDPALFETYDTTPDACEGVMIDHSSLPTDLTCLELLGPPYTFDNDDGSSLLRCHSNADTGASYVCGDDIQPEVFASYDMAATISNSVRTSLDPAAQSATYQACLTDVTGCFSVDTAGNPVFNAGPPATEDCSILTQDNDCNNYFPLDEPVACQEDLLVTVQIIDGAGNLLEYAHDAHVKVFNAALGELDDDFTDVSGQTSFTLPPGPVYTLEVDYFGYVYDSLPSFTTPHSVVVDLVSRECNADCTNQFDVCDVGCWGVDQCGLESNYASGNGDYAFDNSRYIDPISGDPLYSSAAEAQAGAFETLQTAAPTAVGLEARSQGDTVVIERTPDFRRFGVACDLPYQKEEVEQAVIDSSSAKNLIKYSRVTTYDGEPVRIVVATGK